MNEELEELYSLEELTKSMKILFGEQFIDIEHSERTNLFTILIDADTSTQKMIEISKHFLDSLENILENEFAKNLPKLCIVRT